MQCKPIVIHQKKLEKIKMRFFSQIDKSPGHGPFGNCHLWLGYRVAGKYGRFGMMGGGFSTHRIAFFFEHNRPPKEWVLHTCDNPQCVNPAHLFEGNYLDNVRDMVAKGRNAKGERHGSHTKPERVARGDRQGTHTHPESIPRGAASWFSQNAHLAPRGERHHNAKLTEESIRYIRSSFSKEQRGSGPCLARELGITKQCILQIVNRKTWRHVE